MRFLIVNSDYPEFIKWLYAGHPGLERLSFEEQMRVRAESFFGSADAYSYNLRKLGNEVYEVRANNEFAQKAWSKEHCKKVDDWKWQFRMRRGVVPWFSRVKDKSWFYEILYDQIKHYKPDVLLNQAMEWVNSGFLKEIKTYCNLLVGQIAAPLPKDEVFKCHDLIVSSLPNFVDYFLRNGIPAEFHRLAFDPRVLNLLENGAKKIAVSFIGSLSPQHQSRIELLEKVCAKYQIDIWGQDIEKLPADSLIWKNYKGKLWGADMYRTLNYSKMTINKHIDIAESYANNMRLYEATGVGTLLVTDWKSNLHELFDPEKEVVSYRSDDECIEKIKYYLTHDAERESIAAAGQKKTLTCHTYYQRMVELVDIIKKYT